MGNFFFKNNSNNINNTTNSTNTTTNSYKIKKTEVIKSDKDLKINKFKFKIDLEKYEIKFINSFNDELNDKYIKLFKRYKRIIFGFSFNHKIKNKIPTNIIFIQFAHNFNQSIDNMILDDDTDNSKLKELIFGNHFNQQVNNLFQGIEKITFGYKFNQDVSNLPTTIEYLKFGNDFNQSVDYLPSSLICVIFGNNFNQSIDNLPSLIEELDICGNEFNYQIQILPNELKKIKYKILFCKFRNIKKNNEC
jgi:hypothetical protein